MLDRLDETIVAISSAPGRGPLGILRITGPRAIEIADAWTLLPHGRLLELPGWIRTRGEVLLAADARVAADVLLFRAPRTYTRQDLVEIHTIGCSPLLEIIRQLAVLQGARSAEPGEFTARAFLNGRIDLAAAEGVAAVIRAQSDVQLRAARRLMDGTLAERVRGAKEELAELLALVEADIDFAEEPIEFITPPELSRRLAGLMKRLRDLLERGVSMERLDVLPRILLVGPPNAGKSTLMNRLSGTDRAICAAVAGTTRDLLTAPVRLGRIEALLVDSAGIDSTEDGLITQARAMTLSELERVDAVCVVFDASVAPDPEFLTLIGPLSTARRVVVANKCDLLNLQPNDLAADRLAGSASVAAIAEWVSISAMNQARLIPMSARTGEGIEALRAALADLFDDVPSLASAETLFLTHRQQDALRSAASALARAQQLSAKAAETSDTADLLAFELRESLDALASVAGEVTTEDLLAHVFSKFCIGK